MPKPYDFGVLHVFDTHPKWKAHVSLLSISRVTYKSICAKHRLKVLYVLEFACLNSIRLTLISFKDPDISSFPWAEIQLSILST